MTKILAIDDREDNLISLSAILKSLVPGCTLITAQSGPEGIEKAKTELPDTILLDIKMPGMDGYETCKRLKANKDTEHIPVIMISAIMTGSQDLIKGLDTGADAYLAKPIDEHVLIAQIKTALRMKSAEDALRRQKDILENLVQERTVELTQSIIQMKHEIDERKKAEKMVQKNERELRETLNDLLVGVVVHASDTSIILNNTQSNKILGLTDDQMLGKKAIDPVWNFINEDSTIMKVENYPVNKVISSKKPLYDFFLGIIRPDRDYVTWVIVNAIPVFSNDHELEKVIINFIDITARKRLESQLQQAQKMESIGTLAGGIAHDFNNILFPVLGYAEMLLEDVPEDSPFRSSINVIYTSALRAKSLVKQILTFSRQESSELTLMKMQPIVKEALKLIRSTIPTTIEIKQDINPDCGVIKADPTQIHQIVMNLATNAYHAMEETGGEIKVSLKQVELGEYDRIIPDMTPGIYACLTVADTGKGMDKNLTDKIFDPYFTTKAIGKGTGMGLSVVHGIVTAMGGAIHVYSEPGKGTEFHVYLPVEKNFSEEQVIHSKIEIQGGTEQILLVDDEEAILSMEKRMLERLGYHVTSRFSSLEALEAFRADPDKFDLIITDMAMPNMSGDKLSVELTKIRPAIPVLLCTGFSEKISEEKAASLGIKGFLFKPIVMSDLSQKIREILDEN